MLGLKPSATCCELWRNSRHLAHHPSNNGAHVSYFYRTTMFLGFSLQFYFPIAFMMFWIGVKGVKGMLVAQFAKAARGGASAL